SNPMGSNKRIPTSELAPTTIIEIAKINQMIPSRIKNSTEAAIEISAMGNIENKNANKINLSTILICNGTQILKTVLSLCKGRRFLVYYVVTFSPIETLELLAMLNLLLELLFSFLPSLK
ncbi:hypothetical protein, partial [Salmonella enterica]|uniref:hypothetical protein n=1 Tax=Salmonella enterica TaxID=28901 RepID=UPI003526B57F